MSGANAGATPAALAGAYTGYLKDRSHMSLDERFLDSRVLSVKHSPIMSSHCIHIRFPPIVKAAKRSIRVCTDWYARSLLISSQFRAPGKGELLSTETNPDREWRQYNLVGRTKRFHYGLHDIYKSSCDETRTNGRSGMFHKALVAPAKVYKHLGLHHAIEVESADGSRKYWDADKGADGYLKPRSQLWSQRDMDHVVTRIPVCRANYTDAENDMICEFFVLFSDHAQHETQLQFQMNTTPALIMYSWTNMSQGAMRYMSWMVYVAPIT